MYPDPETSCGPYTPAVQKPFHVRHQKALVLDKFDHDTIGMVVIDSQSNVAAGTSTNGLRHKIPGYIIANKYHNSEYSFKLIILLITTANSCNDNFY